MRRDAFETASSELLNTIQGNTKQIYKAYNTRQYKANIQGIQGIEGKAIDVWMNRNTGKALWSTVGQRNTGSPAGFEAQGGARSVRRDALEIASSEPLNTRQYKANLQGIQGIEGKAIDVWMNRNTVEKCCGARWGMVAKHRIPGRIQAQGGARSVRRDALEIASSEPLNTRHTRHTMQNKAYKA